MKKEDFIVKARVVHGDKFDYSLLPDEFLSKMKVPVVCGKHGVFLINTDNHIHNKRGCSACGNMSRSVNNRDSISSVMLQIGSKHQDLRIDYTGYSDKSSVLKVACTCGNFFISTAKDLLRTKYGCPSCALIGRGVTRRKTLDDFITKANVLHKGRYDYSRVVIETFQNKVEIICKIHGSFWQSPTVHVKGHGCPICATSWDSNSTEFTLYVLKICESFGKVGITSNFKLRLETLNKKNKLKSDVIKIYTFKEGQHVKNLESYVMSDPDVLFSALSKHDYPDGYTETFHLKDLDKVIARISNYKPD